MFTAWASTLSASVRRGAGVAGPVYGSFGALSWTFCASVRESTRMPAPSACAGGNGVATGAEAGGAPRAGVLGGGGRGDAGGDPVGVWGWGRPPGGRGRGKGGGGGGARGGRGPGKGGGTGGAGGGGAAAGGAG